MTYGPRPTKLVVYDCASSLVKLSSGGSPSEAQAKRILRLWIKQHLLNNSPYEAQFRNIVALVEQLALNTIVEA